MVGILLKAAVTLYLGVSAALLYLDGIDGKEGQNGADGVNGKDGVSIVFKGELASHPDNPQNGWGYRNTSDKKSYVYQSGAWYQMTVDGVDGANGKDGLDGINGKDGKDGLDVVWQGDSPNPPANPQKNWAYRDTDNGVVYIYNGTAWVMMVADGSDGEAGAKGNDGNSVFITYHDNPTSSKPAKPTGNGTTGGWHTSPSSRCVWMSQKVALTASTGEWGEPIQIQGKGVDELEIGGVNLLDNSQRRSAYHGAEYNEFISLPVRPGQDISVTLKNNQSEGIMIYIGFNRWAGDNVYSKVVTSGQKAVCTATIPSDAKGLYIGIMRDTWRVIGNYDVGEIMVEWANKSSAWRPTDNDIVNGIMISGVNLLDSSQRRSAYHGAEYLIFASLPVKQGYPLSVSVRNNQNDGLVIFVGFSRWAGDDFDGNVATMGQVSSKIITVPNDAKNVIVGIKRDTWRVIGNYDVGEIMVEWASKPSPWRLSPNDLQAQSDKARLYQGIYIAGRSYQNNLYRQDIVKYGSAWYSYIGPDGQVQGSWNSANWEPFGSSWESVATNLLLAENANIAEFIFRNQRMESQATANGVPKIFLDGVNGKAQFLDVQIEGTQRNPFVLWDSGRNVFNGDAVNVKRDNVVMPISSTTIYENGFSWGAENSGRIIRLVHYKWDYSTSYGYVTLKAPAGKYFYENGVAYTQINTSRETVELLGYGTPTQFYGWIVLSRVNTMTDGNYGANKKVIYQGVFNHNYYYGIERSWSASLEATGIPETWIKQILGEGHYKIWMPIYLANDAFHVTVNGCLCGMNGSIPSNASNIYACLVNKGYDSSKGVSFFEVKTADDASPNHGGFYFEVIGTYNWATPTPNGYAARSMSLLSDNSEPETETPDIITFSTHYNH